MTWLLDGNILVALMVTTHAHHDRVRKWWPMVDSFATCAITQGTFLRVFMLTAQQGSPSLARHALACIERLDGYEFWRDGFGYTEVNFDRIQSHKDVTDAWLAELARRRGAKLATLDEGLARKHPEVVFLIP